MSSISDYDKQYYKFQQVDPFEMAAMWNAMSNHREVGLPPNLQASWEKETNNLFTPLVVPPSPRGEFSQSSNDETAINESGSRNPMPRKERRMSRKLANLDQTKKTKLYFPENPSVFCRALKPIPPSTSRKVAWKPRMKQLPWPKGNTDNHKSAEEDKWTLACAKWQAIAEEAGTEHSELARMIHQERISAGEIDKRMVLSVEENFAKTKPKIEACLQDLFVETFGRKAAATLNGRAGSFLIFARWVKNM